jgi:hypothetical protein
VSAFDDGYDQAMWEIRAFAETRGLALASGLTAVEAVEIIVFDVEAREAGLL